VPDLTELAGAGARVAVTANAFDRAGDRPRKSWVEQELRALAAAGLSPFELDLRDYCSQPDGLRRALAAVDMVWATGGNAFVLRDAISRSGLDSLLSECLRDDSLAYGGFSAGACVCAPTLRGIELMDDPRKVRNPVWDGLGLVDFSIVPHYGTADAQGKSADRVVAYFRAHGMSYRTLRDGQAIIVRDGSAPTIAA
jgi:dipeptidase E